jgi:hypothetical protein
MPFRCDRCSPPKYYCEDHRLPASHDCIGKEIWRTTRSTVSEIAIGYERGEGAMVITGSGHGTGTGKPEGRVPAIPLTELPAVYADSGRSKSWFARLKEKVLKLFK